MENTSNAVTILVVEDSTLLWSSMKRAIRTIAPHARVECVGSLEDSFEYLQANRPNLIICDYFLPNLRFGLELWEHPAIQSSGIPFLLMSGMGTESFLSLMKEKNARECPPFLPKPFHLDRFAQTVEHLLALNDERVAA